MVVSHEVAAWLSKPVPVSSAVPSGQVNCLPPAMHGGPPPQPHTSRKALLTLIGLACMSKAMLPSAWPIGIGSSIATKKSLNWLHT